MLKAILFFFLCISAPSLEISLQSAKENYEPYSTLHVKDKERFLCREILDDFQEVSQIVCAFNKAPSKDIQKLQNNFFEIETQMRNKTFFIIIKPLYKMKLFAMIFDLKKDENVFSPKTEISNHWMIVGYEKELPFLSDIQRGSSSINFPFTSSNDMLPYVGSLDIKGNPVHINRVGDVKEYLKIKDLYAQNNYEFALELIEEVMREYPDSLFRAELLFYKIRLFSKLNEHDKLVEEAKEYLREYSSDDNVAEVLSVLSRAYSKLGQHSDAEYFFDRLFSEHPESVYAQWGYIYMADALEDAAAFSKAKTLYEKVLRESRDVDVALEAAFKLSKSNINDSNFEEAAKSAQKIVDARPEYFVKKELFRSMDMMYDFADNGRYGIAVEIAKAIFEHMDPADEMYEEVARNAAIWLSYTDKKKEALGALNRYLELFPNGMYAQEVQVAKDMLFFDIDDDNSTARFAAYDKLIEEYSGDTIGAKAIYEKAKLLIAQERFSEALDMENELLKLPGEEYKDVADMIKQAAVGAMKYALEAKECESVLVTSYRYNIELSQEWDDGVYECAMRGADFELARKTAERNLSSKEIEQRKKWLYRHIKVDFATGNYSNVLEASKELVSLIKDKKDSEFKEIYRYIFDTYARLENQDKMIEAMSDVYAVFGNDYRDIERYVAVMSAGSEKKDPNLVIEYGRKVADIQKASDSNAQSPFVEFALYSAYMDKEDYAAALQVVSSLDAVELDKNARARQKYLLGTVLEKLWRDDEAQKAYDESVKADESSAWAELAKSAKSL